jgi:hypothetical protein
MAKRTKIWISRDAKTEDGSECENLFLWFEKPILDENGEWNNFDQTDIRILYNAGRNPGLPNLEYLSPNYGECVEYVLTQTKVLK